MSNLVYQFNSTKISNNKLSIDGRLEVNNIQPYSANSLQLGDSNTKIYLGSSLAESTINSFQVPLTKQVIGLSSEPIPTHLDSSYDNAGIDGWYWKGLGDSSLINWSPINSSNTDIKLSSLSEIFMSIRIISAQLTPFINISGPNGVIRWHVDPLTTLSPNTNYLFKIPLDISNSNIIINNFTPVNLIQDLTNTTGTIDINNDALEISIGSLGTVLSGDYEFIVNSLGFISTNNKNNIKICNFSNAHVLAQFNLRKTAYLYDLLLRNNIYP